MDAASLPVPRRQRRGRSIRFAAAYGQELLVLAAILLLMALVGAKNARFVSRTSSLKISEWKRIMPSESASVGFPWSPSATWRPTAARAFSASSPARIQ